MPTSFAGTLEVEPNDFEFNFNPFVIHDHYVSFRIHAREPDGDDWFIDDRISFGDGRSESEVLTMHFKSGASCKAKLTIIDLQKIDVICKVVARLEQFEQEEEAVWQVSGELQMVANAPDNTA